MKKELYILKLTTISGISTHPTQMMAIMQSNHLTMSHEYISGKYRGVDGRLFDGVLLFSFVVGHDSELIEKLRMNSAIYDLEIIEGE